MSRLEWPKNVIMAHAENNTVIKAEADVHITAEGEDVYVNAKTSVGVSVNKHIMVNAVHNVTVMAGDTVTVKADDDITTSRFLERMFTLMLMMNDDFKIMANNDVIVDAAIDGSDTGNGCHHCEGVKYFPQKKEICNKDDYEYFVIRVEANPHLYGMGAKDFIYEDGGDIPGINSNTVSRIELCDDEGHLAFGNITIGSGLGCRG